MKKISALIAGVLSITISTATRADFIDAQWWVVGFAGEAWYVDTQEIIGQSQTFYRGYAEGVFYSCNYYGQSSTYTRYSNDEFFSNPEFKLFLPMQDGMSLNSEFLFVHRITCEGGGNPNQRRVIYPFVTNEARKSAWYLFEGGVFSLFRP